MDYVLPATVYQPPPSRPSQRRQLNTILEDNEDTIHGSMSESDGVWSDSTLVRTPGFVNTKDHASLLQSKNQQLFRAMRKGPPSAVSSDVSSECDGEEEDDDDDRYSDNCESMKFASRSSYVGSEDGTVFSESCPSLTGSHASNATSFATDSTRNSIASRQGRSQLPPLIIPRTSWSDFENEIKQIPFGMSPATKVRLSPQTLDLLPRNIPSIDAPPSLADTGSVRSSSPCPNAFNSAPVTPDLHNLEVHDGEAWGQPTISISLNTSLEIAIDEDHSMLLSAVEAHSDPHLPLTARSSRNWNEIVRRFPSIPGATPTTLTPITPEISQRRYFPSPTTQSGVRLPEEAFEMLENLNRKPCSVAMDSPTPDLLEEMLECAVPKSRPESWRPRSASTEDSISQLSIPSPGGFFASLKAGTRHTWSAPPPPRRMSPPPPSSTTAENFYRTPWAQSGVQPDLIKETVIESSDKGDGPPTVTQATFNIGQEPLKEDDDMYGDSDVPAPSTHEHEETYFDDVKNREETNISRTNDWLANQNNLLAVLRDDMCISNPAQTSPISETTRIAESEELIAAQNLKAIHFLAEAKAAATPRRETLFLEAFKHQKSEAKRCDVFTHASSRLGTVQSSRITLPKRHAQALLNTYTSRTLDSDHPRPKYRGPFSQNPRATGDFTRTAEQAMFSTLERQQNALNAIQLSVWTLEAQRAILYNGRLMANRATFDRLTETNSRLSEIEPLKRPNKKCPRILDLAGAPTASWAWATAARWPNLMVYTVQTKQQAELARNYATSGADDVESCPPETPINHKVCSVPHLWQLPFPNNYFDVISARTLHMHLRATPVPSAKSIDEWDMTLKECMRVLKPGGILDFFVMDSGISLDTSVANNAVDLSPSNVTSNAISSDAASGMQRKNVALEFQSELERRGYESDGGCRRLMGRLKQSGFERVKRQWIGLPMGHCQHESTSARFYQRTTSTISATSQLINQPQLDTKSQKASFMPAPRPISEVSTISKFIDQYADVEAVRGPVGSTIDVADISALLGELLWEEWLVRLRIESGKYTSDTMLDGIDEQFNEWRRSGKAAWRGIIGWARKPTKKSKTDTGHASTASYISSAPTTSSFGHELAIETPLETPRSVPSTICTASSGLQRRAHVRTSRRMSGALPSPPLTINTDVASLDFRRVTRLLSQEFSMSALERGEIGDIPVLMVG